MNIYKTDITQRATGYYISSLAPDTNQLEKIISLVLLLVSVKIVFHQNV